MTDHGDKENSCRAARRREGGEAERKWTWRSDQNIVRQGNKVKWSRAAIPLETKSMRVLLKVLPQMEFRMNLLHNTISCKYVLVCSKHVLHVLSRGSLGYMFWRTERRGEWWSTSLDPATRPTLTSRRSARSTGLPGQGTGLTSPLYRTCNCRAAGT